MHSFVVTVVVAVLCGHTAVLFAEPCEGIGSLECYFCQGFACNSGCIRGETCINITDSDKFGCISDPIRLADGCANHTLLGRLITLCVCSTNFCNGNVPYHAPTSTSTTHTPAPPRPETTTDKPGRPTTAATTKPTTPHAGPTSASTTSNSTATRPATVVTTSIPTTARRTTLLPTTTLQACAGQGSLECFACTSYPPQPDCKTGCVRGETCQVLRVVPNNPEGAKFILHSATPLKLPNGCTTVSDDYRTVTNCNCDSNFCNTADTVAFPLLTSILLSVASVAVSLLF